MRKIQLFKCYKTVHTFFQLEFPTLLSPSQSSWKVSMKAWQKKVHACKCKSINLWEFVFVAVEMNLSGLGLKWMLKVSLCHHSRGISMKFMTKQKTHIARHFRPRFFDSISARLFTQTCNTFSKTRISWNKFYDISAHYPRIASEKLNFLNFKRQHCLFSLCLFFKHNNKPTSF